MPVSLAAAVAAAEASAETAPAAAAPAKPAPKLKGTLKAVKAFSSLGRKNAKKAAVPAAAAAAEATPAAAPEAAERQPPLDFNDDPETSVDISIPTPRGEKKQAPVAASPVNSKPATTVAQPPNGAAVPKPSTPKATTPQASTPPPSAAARARPATKAKVGKGSSYSFSWLRALFVAAIASLLYVRGAEVSAACEASSCGVVEWAHALVEPEISWLLTRVNPAPPPPPKKLFGLFGGS